MMIIIVRKSANKFVHILFFLKNWLAYDVLPGSWNITERGKLHFSGLGAPKKENNYAFCQVERLTVFYMSLMSLCLV